MKKNLLKSLLFTLLLSSCIFAQTLTAELSFDNDKYFIGETAVATVTVNNHGFSDANNVKINLKTDFWESSRTIPKLNERSDKDVSFDIPISGDYIGKYYVTGHITWSDDLYEIEKQGISIQESPLEITTSSGDLTFTISIKNTGDDDLTDIDISLEIPGHDGVDHNINKLTPGEQWSKTLHISTSAKYAHISIQYDADEVTHTYISAENIDQQILTFPGIEILLLLVIVVIVLKLFVFK